MRILLTNHALVRREGSELYVRDLAKALLARGQEPIVYSRRLGEVAGELRTATIPVVDDLDHLEEPPDLIHAQHHLEAMTALTRYPDTPAVYVCHGWLPDEEAPPRHPRIMRYVAVDELVRRRLRDDCGLPAAKVETHLNFVDLAQFQPRPPLPARPGRALVFSNRVSNDNVLPAIQRACEQEGIELEVAGLATGTARLAPEKLLPSFDLVFAKARAALEALAVGASVILCDVAGLGPLVRLEDLDRLRALNLGVRLLRDPITPETLRERIRQYDAEDASEVSRSIRADAGLENATLRVLDLYRRVLEEFQEARPAPAEEARATSRYLRRGPLTAGDFFAHERLDLQARLSRAEERSNQLESRWQDVCRDRDLLKEEVRQTRATLADALDDSQSRIHDEVKDLSAQIQGLAASFDREEKDFLLARLSALQASNASQERELVKRRQVEADLRGELAWVLRSRTWRLRSLLLRFPGLAAVLRAFG